MHYKCNEERPNFFLSLNVSILNQVKLENVILKYLFLFVSKSIFFPLISFLLILQKLLALSLLTSSSVWNYRASLKQKGFHSSLFLSALSSTGNFLEDYHILLPLKYSLTHWIRPLSKIILNVLISQGETFSMLNYFYLVLLLLMTQLIIPEWFLSPLKNKTKLQFLKNLSKFPVFKLTLLVCLYTCCIHCKHLYKIRFF